MAFSLESLRVQLSAVEPTEATYAGIGPAELPLLRRLLNDNEGWMAARAVTALARIADPEAVRLLRQAAADPRPHVRTAVAVCAGMIAPGEANPVLTALLADAELGVRKAAIRSVSAEHSAAVRTVLQSVRSQDPVPRLREMATAKAQELSQ